jgi:hypothetical protein
MKALISPTEIFTWTWVTSWVWSPFDGEFVPETTDSIKDCQRVAEVKEQEFEVALPLFWFDCPNNCVQDEWYYKNGQVQPKPQNAPVPELPLE